MSQDTVLQAMAELVETTQPNREGKRRAAEKLIEQLLEYNGKIGYRITRDAQQPEESGTCLLYIPGIRTPLGIYFYEPVNHIIVANEKGSIKIPIELHYNPLLQIFEGREETYNDPLTGQPKKFRYSPLVTLFQTIQENLESSKQ